MFVAKNVTVKAGKSVEISIVDADGNSVMLDNFNGYGGDNNQAENLVYINDQLFQLEMILFWSCCIYKEAMA